MISNHEIDYKIYGEELQFVEIELDPQETVVGEPGGFMMMDSDVQMATIFGDGSQSNTGGLLGKLMNAGKRLLVGENLFMNASGGFSLDIYPSNVETSNYTRVDSTMYDFTQKTWKNKWVQVALLANYGFEWRSRESGYFYFGASYHRPFNYIGITQVVVERNNVPSRADALLRGNYLTADFRYFFNEKLERRKPKD